jgi:hypothetical protein
MTKAKEDCYLWMDQKVPADQRTIKILCEQCHLKFPELGWFWEGSRLGYGPFDFICDQCGHVVHSAKEKTND